MPWLRRNWTPAEADEWRKEDWIAMLLSTISYIALTVGVALSLLLLTVGFIVLGLGIVITVLLFYVIDPKLKAVSSGYEAKQKEYLENLERIQRWEE